jgi:hypothetical protein
MGGFIKLSTAVTIPIGPIVLATDGNTEYTTAIANTAIYLRKEGGTAVSAKNDATSSTHRAIGIHTVPLNATDTGTVGLLMVATHVSTTLPWWDYYQVLPAMVYDSLCAAAGTDYLQCDVIQFNSVAGTFASGRPEVNTSHAAGTAWGSGAITAASIATGAITNAKFAAGAIDAAAIANAAIDNATFAADVGSTALASNPLALAAAKGSWDALPTNYVIASSFGKYLGGAPAGATVSADIAAVKVDTAAVKVQTDKFVFTVANEVNANTRYWGGGAVHTPVTTGVPLVEIHDGAAAADFTTTMKTSIQTAAAAAITAASLATAANVSTVDNKIGTITNTGGTATIGAILGDFANSALVTRVAAVKTDTNNNYTILNSGTYGNAVIKTAVDAIKTKTDFLPSATAGAAGGVFIAGTNAATTITTALTTTFTGNLTGTLSTTERNAIADAFLDRNMGTGTDSGGRTVRNALRPAVNKIAISAGTTLTVYKEDDTTSAWTAAITTDVAALPITVVDPA